MDPETPLVVTAVGALVACADAVDAAIDDALLLVPAPVLVLELPLVLAFVLACVLPRDLAAAVWSAATFC